MSGAMFLIESMHACGGGSSVAQQHQQHQQREEATGRLVPGCRASPNVLRAFDKLGRRGSGEGGVSLRRPALENEPG